MNINFNIILQKFLPYAFVVLFAYFLASLFSLFLPKMGIDFIKTSSNSFSYEKYDGFYSKSLKVEKITRNKQEVIETLTKYELKAVYSTSINSGWAVIQEKNSDKSIILQQYQKFNSYTLTKLYKNYIIFEKNLKEFKIKLPISKEVEFEKKSTKSSSSKNIVVEKDNVKINRKYLNSYINNVDKIWKNISIKDIRKNGKIDGFKITSIKKKSVFEKIGLLKNDLIKSINGNVITSYAQAFEIYEDINKLEYLTIEVLRNNKIVELNYEID